MRSSRWLLALLPLVCACGSVPNPMGNGGGGAGGTATGGGGTGGASCHGAQQSCSGSSACCDGLVCQSGLCVEDPGDLGQPCTKNADCEQALCLPLGNGMNVCSKPCAGDDQCLAGWTCGTLSGVSGALCQCAPTAETCNGRDDDCNGVVDDGDAANECADGTVCQAGQCACNAPYMTCGGACVDTSSSPDHCGGCDMPCHSSGGDQKTCVAGVCKGVTQLTSAYLGIKALAADAQGVYLTTHGSSNNLPLGYLGHCPSSGCTIPPPKLMDLDNAGGVATDGTHVYAGDRSGVWRAGLSDNQVTLLAHETVGTGDVALSGNVLFWVSFAPGSVMNIKKCTLPACSDAAVVVPQTAVKGRLAVDGNNLYWFTSDTLVRCPRSGCSSPTTLVQGEDHAADLATDGVDVYWSDILGGTLKRCPVSGCAAPTAFASNQSEPWGVALDATYVYWTTDSAVVRCHTSGCTGAPEVVAAPDLGGDSLALLALSHGSAFFSTLQGSLFEASE